jgi:hypothetical protein
MAGGTVASHLLLKSQNHSSIDKTIANLINANKLKTLVPPPHGPFKRLSNGDSGDGFLGVSENNKASFDKKRLKKDKHSLLSNTTNTNTLLPNKQSNIDQRFNKNQLGGNLLLKQPHISSKNNPKLTVNNLTSLKLNESLSSSQQKSAHSSSRHRLNQQQSYHTHPFNTILSARDDYNEIYDSENNYETSSIVVDSKISTMKKSTENNNNTNINSNSTTKTTSGHFDLIELNKRLLTLNNFNIDLNDLNECNTYDQELKLNNVENLEAILNDTKSGLGTNIEKDGDWCFRRKEGCKYLAQNGPIFKHDENKYTISSKKQPSITTATISKTKSRLKQLQYYYYGYAITKRGRHLGLVRRRMGRG